MPRIIDKHFFIIKINVINLNLIIAQPAATK